MRLKIWDFLVERHRSQVTPEEEGAAAWPADATAAATAEGTAGDEHDDDVGVVDGVVNPCSFVGRTDEWKVGVPLLCGICTSLCRRVSFMLVANYPPSTLHILLDEELQGKFRRGVAPTPSRSPNTPRHLF